MPLLNMDDDVIHEDPKEIVSPDDIDTWTKDEYQNRGLSWPNQTLILGVRMKAVLSPDRHKYPGLEFHMHEILRDQKYREESYIKGVIAGHRGAYTPAAPNQTHSGGPIGSPGEDSPLDIYLKGKSTVIVIHLMYHNWTFETKGPKKGLSFKNTFPQNEFTNYSLLDSTTLLIHGNCLTDDGVYGFNLDFDIRQDEPGSTLGNYRHFTPITIDPKIINNGP